MTDRPSEPFGVLPELADSSAGSSRLRLPPSIDVRLTPRVIQMMDTPTMKRMRQVSQLGLVSLVYPGATHSRWEHSLGVYGAAIELLTHLRRDERFVRFATRDGRDAGRAAEAFLLAALLHDAGHWPFCHPIEDMGALPDGHAALPHEQRVETLLRQDAMTTAWSPWRCSRDDVMSILHPASLTQRRRDGDVQLADDEVAFYASCLSGPIDIDKLDYLQRDSLHAGVPYGRNFDSSRLIAAMQLHPDDALLAIDAKGRTAAEMMVFGRYVMFSEVYWHHAVRSATAMLQRAMFEMLMATRSHHRERRDFEIDWCSWADLGDADWIASFCEMARQDGRDALRGLADGLFGDVRRLYKRIGEFSVLSDPLRENDGSTHQRLARRPYWWLVECSRVLATHLANSIGRHVDPLEVLIDAPPVKLEVDINMDVVERDGSVRTLGEISPVVSVLANQQFDNHVKRVRVFVTKRLRDELRERRLGQSHVDERLRRSIDQMEADMV
ncbi:MAG: metal-dependent phosphohydrolase [Planctomycetota bacterium]